MEREVVREASKFWEEVYKSQKIIIYGAGAVCRKLLSVFDTEIREKVGNIAVTFMEGNEEVIEGIQVKPIDELENEKDTTIVIAVRERFVDEIVANLQKKRFQICIVATEEKLDVYKMWKDLGFTNKKVNWIDENITEEKRLDEVYAKALNIGHFVGSVSDETMKFDTISFTWGGSGILDYALIRGLVLKYNLKTYLEIGTYIGDSLRCVSDIVEKCYSISVPETHPAHMKNWCKERHINDHTNKLVTENNMIQFREDSKFFDYSNVTDKIDLYFIDGDHSYGGVFIDSLRVFENLDIESSFVVWHDCRKPVGVNIEIVDAIHEAIGSYFDNFYIFDNCMCGIYIPSKYLNDFDKARKSDSLVTYQVTLKKNKEEL